MPYLNREPLDQLVAEAGMSFGEFARHCGISEVTLSKARNGRAVYPQTLRKLALGATRLKKLKGLNFVTATKPINNNDAAAGKATAPRSIADEARHPDNQA